MVSNRESISINAEWYPISVEEQLGTAGVVGTALMKFGELLLFDEQHRRFIFLTLLLIF